MTALSPEAQPPRDCHAGWREVVAEITHRAIAATPAGDDLVAGVAALQVLDPRNTDHVTAVATVIVRDALGDPLRETTANRWRGLLPSWVRPQIVGATVQRMVAAGLLVATGRYVHCTDRAAKNRGKPQPIYTLVLPTEQPPPPLSTLDIPGQSCPG